MKLFAATNQAQGRRPTDFCWTIEGELVTWPMECGSEGDDPDGGCGCRRSMVGMVSGKGTTTFRVVDLDVDHDEVIEMVVDMLRERGWGDDLVSEADLRSDVIEMVDIVVDEARRFGAGDVLERRGDTIQHRDEARPSGYRGLAED